MHSAIWKEAVLPSRLSGYPKPSEEVLAEWRAITMLLAKACKVEAALVMRGNPESMEVMAASQLEETPYEEGEEAPREGRLYCETVIESQAPLTVVDAFNDPVWEGNPDTELGLASYYGVPVNWPDGEPFGTLCILSRAARTPSEVDVELLERFRSLVELSLRLLLADQALTYAATHDALTDLMNRSMFEFIARKLMAAADRQKQTLWMVFWDLDHFKAVNDELGHAAGDELLRDVAGHALEALRASDALARIGGEEFATVIVDGDRCHVKDVVKRLMHAVGQASVPGLPAGWRLTISCGVAARRPGETLKEWMGRADALMYEAKRGGRDRYVLEPAMDATQGSR